MITTINGVMYERAAEKEGLTCWLSLAFIADYEASVLPQAIRRFGDYALKELADYIENPLQYHITNGYTAKSGADYTDKYGNPVTRQVDILITDEHLRPWPHRNLNRPPILDKNRGSDAQAGELFLASPKSGEARPVVDSAPAVFPAKLPEIGSAANKVRVGDTLISRANDLFLVSEIDTLEKYFIEGSKKGGSYRSLSFRNFVEQKWDIVKRPAPKAEKAKYPIFGITNNGMTMWREDSPNACVYLHVGGSGGRGFAQQIDNLRTNGPSRLVTLAAVDDWLDRHDLRKFYEESCQPEKLQPWKSHGARVRFTDKAIMHEDEDYNREGEEGTVERCSMVKECDHYGPGAFRIVSDDPTQPYAIHYFHDIDMKSGGQCEGWLEPVWPETKVTLQSSKEKDVEARMVGARVFMSTYGVNVWLPEVPANAATMFKNHFGWKQKGGFSLNMLLEGREGATEVFGSSAAANITDLKHHLINAS